MSEKARFTDHIMLLADYKNPEPHRHLATHIMLSLGENMEWNINGKNIYCRGICIGPDVWHTGNSFSHDTLVFLFSQISNYSCFLEEKILCGKPYAILDDKLVNQALEAYYELSDTKQDSDKTKETVVEETVAKETVLKETVLKETVLKETVIKGTIEKEKEKAVKEKAVKEISESRLISKGQDIDQSILAILGIGKEQPFPYDERVREVFAYISHLDTIGSDIMETLSENACLSKSRLSHLFREQTGMTLHSYLALEKVHKTYNNIREGKNITESCLTAGFASPSHCAATCRRMFGISITEFLKR